MCPEFMLEAHQQIHWILFRRAAEAGPVLADDIPLADQPAIGDVSLLAVLQHFGLCCPGAYFNDEIQAPETRYIFPALLKDKCGTEDWQHLSDFDKHVGLQFTCAKTTQMLPPGMFPRIQMHLASHVSGTLRNLVRVWKDAIWLGIDDVQCLVRLAADDRSIVAHARAHSGAQSATTLEVLLLVSEAVKASLAVSKGLQLAVSYCSVDNLKSYKAEPAGYPLRQVLNARRQGKKCVILSITHTESLTLLTGVPEDHIPDLAAGTTIDPLPAGPNEDIDLVSQWLRNDIALCDRILQETQEVAQCLPVQFLTDPQYQAVLTRLERVDERMDGLQNHAAANSVDNAASLASILQVQQRVDIVQDGQAALSQRLHELKEVHGAATLRIDGLQNETAEIKVDQRTLEGQVLTQTADQKGLQVGLTVQSQVTQDVQDDRPTLSEAHDAHSTAVRDTQHNLAAVASSVANANARNDPPKTTVVQTQRAPTQCDEQHPEPETSSMMQTETCQRTPH
eukprot:m.370159 g.370159  ORF g.370159 m.370159 type:complete len:509 (-) comp56122_c1_seq26:288-1814(-)